MVFFCLMAKETERRAEATCSHSVYHQPPPLTTVPRISVLDIHSFQRGAISPMFQLSTVLPFRWYFFNCSVKSNFSYFSVCCYILLCVTRRGTKPASRIREQTEVEGTLTTTKKMKWTYVVRSHHAWNWQHMDDQTNKVAIPETREVREEKRPGREMKIKHIPEETERERDGKCLERPLFCTGLTMADDIIVTIISLQGKVCKS